MIDSKKKEVGLKMNGKLSIEFCKNFITEIHEKYINKFGISTNLLYDFSLPIREGEFREQSGGYYIINLGVDKSEFMEHFDEPEYEISVSELYILTRTLLHEIFHAIERLCPEQLHMFSKEGLMELGIFAVFGKGKFYKTNYEILCTELEAESFSIKESRDIFSSTLQIDNLDALMSQDIVDYFFPDKNPFRRWYLSEFVFKDFSRIEDFLEKNFEYRKNCNLDTSMLDIKFSSLSREELFSLAIDINREEILSRADIEKDFQVDSSLTKEDTLSRNKGLF